MNYLKKVYLNWFTLGITIGLIPFMIILYSVNATIGTEMLIPVLPWAFNFLIKWGLEIYD